MSQFASLRDVGSRQHQYLKCSRVLASHLFRELGMPIPFWSRRGGGFPVPCSLVGDLLAAADQNGVRVALVGQAKPESA